MSGGASTRHTSPKSPPMVSAIALSICFGTIVTLSREILDPSISGLRLGNFDLVTRHSCCWWLYSTWNGFVRRRWSLHVWPLRELCIIDCFSNACGQRPAFVAWLSRMQAFTRSISYREPCGKEGRTRNSLGRMNEERKEERLNERKERGAW